jgi:hypothetical protein
MVSLPACQQRALERIEKTLLAGDPRLGSLFAIFTRLTRHEAIPGTEQVKPRPWQALQAFAGIAIALIAVLSVLALSSLPLSQHECGTRPAAPGQSRSWSRTTSCTPVPAMLQDRQYLR